MKMIRRILYKTLGVEGYYKFVSKVYLLLVGNGFLKKKYPELFYLKKIIKPGFHCLDIGANMGYYSTTLSKLAGEKGKVYAVEPIPLFASIWKQNVRMSAINNLTLFPYALGASNGKVTMGTPEVDGLARHGLTKIATASNEKYAQSYEVEMKVPDELFKTFPSLDFIKCDVEGYEYHVFSNMKETLKKFKPLIQVEISAGESKKAVIELLRDLGYKTYLLKNERLVEANDEQIQHPSSDFYFLN